MASGGSSESLVPRREEETLNEDEGDKGLARTPKSLRSWPTVSQLRVAVSKLRQDLDELQSPPVLPSMPGARPEQSAPASAPPAIEFRGNLRPVGSGRAGSGSVGAGPLAFYHRGVAVRMLKDYLEDLVVLNTRQLEGVAESVRQPRLQTVQKRIEEYQEALDEMVEANEQEPNGQLTWKERDILKRMLEDYSRGLEEFLDYPDEIGGRDKLEDQLAMLRAKIDLVDAGMPLDFSETRFDVMVESLTASLEGCETQVLDISQLREFEVFNRQCSFLVETLLPTAKERLGRYNVILGVVQKLEVEEYEVSTRQRIFKSVAFCIESLSEFARQLQAVLDLLTLCGAEKWWITALELSNAAPQFTIPRWNSFSLAIRSSEWSMDILELAFHALDQLLDGQSTLRDVFFNWSDEQRRTVLEINDKPVHRQDSRIGRSGLLAFMRELEAEDVADLIQKLVELTKKPRKRWIGVFNDEDSNMHAIAEFLSKKLDGPIPGVNSLPYSFQLNFDDLKYSHYIDSGASGMVAEYKWFGQKLAVKTVKSPGLERKKFEEEAAILATVQHPYVVRMLGCTFNSKLDSGLLAMELMEHDLRTVIEKRCPQPGPGQSPFPLIVAIDIMLQIAEGMLYLRENRILHRDLKAKNVLLNRCRRVRRSLSAAYRKFPVLASLLHTEEYYYAKLADFGIAKAKPLQSLTQMVGTTPWRAPEVFYVPDLETAPHYKWPADVYSFAMTCYEILTGNIPFNGIPNTKIYDNIMAGERPPLDDVTILSPALKDLIELCWATDPSDRPNFADICRKLWQCKVETILPVFRLHLSPSSSRSF